ncbi:MAG: hypothetical protein P0Y58_22350 [Candidatus Pseudomonas phytovorans]|uniref:Uncharacterized protein n=1 Tax=Candidatus Pseudomonas phytovorans TaxID=3121377 RepID=A0AAJ5WH62_9PSED|nr:hypothetical protein [Pseudomonas sp.]WEK29608.1 MAG: hypothetical protein P0Y58_22350 [Pseudomonas sp.]
MNKCFIALCFLLTSAYTHAGDWEVFGDWKVMALHGDMDTVTKVVVTIGFNDTPKLGSPFAPKNDLTIGFIIYGERLVILSPSIGFVGEMYWSSRDYDLSSVSVDGKKAVRLTPVEDPGSCNNVAKNGEALRQMMNDTAARMRVGYTDGTASLKGFKAAWARALKLSRG